MAPAFLLSALPAAIGFGTGWAGFTLVLTVATRPMKLGPGFSNLLPYAVAAILLTGAGHLVRWWLNQTSSPASIGKDGFFPAIGRAWVRGLLAFFKGTAAFNNFVFLSVAYFLGIGVTSLFVRSKPRKTAAPPAEASNGAAPTASASYWQDLNLGKQEADAYYRPF